MPFEGIIGILSFAVMLALIIAGIPVFISMLIPTVVGLWIVGGPTLALEICTTGLYNISSSYLFAVVPMFVLMGILAADCGIAEEAYDTLAKWMTRLRGGLLMATIGANAIYGAVSGVATGGTVVFTKMVMSQLDKFGFSRSLSSACIAASAVLDALIPPSLPIVVTCLIVDLSIEKALIAGIMPGILLTVMMSITVWVVALVRPKSVPVINITSTWGEKFSSLKTLWPVLLLFLLMMGGMYLGIFPPTVGGAIGCFGILVYAFAMRRMNIRQFVDGCWESVLIYAQIFPLILGGMIFGRLIALSGLAQAFNTLITSGEFSPLAVLCIILVFYLFLGCIMDLSPIIIITLPIVFPLLTGLGYDPYAIMVILLMVGAIGSITPPIGMSCFVVASAAKMDVIEVYRGILPFFVVQMLFIVLLICFPAIASWLPNLITSGK